MPQHVARRHLLFERPRAAGRGGVGGHVSAVPVLIEVLSDVKVNVRRRAAEALRLIGDPAAVPGLVEALNDPDYRVRDEASRPWSGSTRARPALRWPPIGESSRPAPDCDIASSYRAPGSREGDVEERPARLRNLHSVPLVRRGFRASYQLTHFRPSCADGGSAEVHKTTFSEDRRQY